MRNLIYLPKWLDVLVKIHKVPEHKRYCQKLNREVKTSINHLRNIVKYLEEHELIRIIYTKKIKHLELTEKGKRIALAVLNMQTELKCL